MTHLERANMTVFLSTTSRKATDKKKTKESSNQTTEIQFKCIMLPLHSDSRHVLIECLSSKRSEHLMDNQMGPNRIKHLEEF